MKCINIYSKSKDRLGRWLSNFTYHPIETEDGPFVSIEGYWYWLSCKDDRLRKSYGYNAKKLGRELGAKDWLDTDEFKRKIKEAIRIKLETAPDSILTLMKEKNIIFDHYYQYGDKKIPVSEGEWIVDFIQEWYLNKT